jgi:hypothetical protein
MSEYLIACPIDWQESRVLGSTGGYHCSECGCEVMLAPSGRGLTKTHDLVIVCYPCFQQMEKGDDLELHMPHARECIAELETKRDELRTRLVVEKLSKEEQNEIQGQIDRIATVQRALAKMRHDKN